MKAKALKKIRKYWEYSFCKGKLYMRRKSDGLVCSYGSIEQFIGSWISENMGINAAGQWYRNKRRIADNKRWKEVTNCSS